MAPEGGTLGRSQPGPFNKVESYREVQRHGTHGKSRSQPGPFNKIEIRNGQPVYSITRCRSQPGPFNKVEICSGSIIKKDTKSRSQPGPFNKVEIVSKFGCCATK